jgi:ribosome recycling factor
MQEDVDLYMESAQEDMDAAIAHLQRELSKIRTGKASPNIFDGLMVSYYGMATPLKQVASVIVPDARTIAITPYEKGTIAAIEKSIFEANMGLTPQNNGELIRISVPPLTEERRREYVKQAKSYCENAKVTIRGARREAISGIKDAVKDGYSEDAGKNAEESADGMSKKYYAKIEALMNSKEVDIMKV